jgi:hypothetical protein
MCKVSKETSQTFSATGIGTISSFSALNMSRYNFWQKKKKILHSSFTQFGTTFVKNKKINQVSLPLPTI